jgi:serine/threonine protein kinase
MMYREICPPETLEVLAFIMNSLPAEKKKIFRQITRNEISKEDRALILKIMKLDPRDRPSARELPEDNWFDIL